MKSFFLIQLSIFVIAFSNAQNVLSPELLWELGRVSPLGISKDSKNVIYKVTTPSLENNSFSSKIFSISIDGGNAIEIKDYKNLIEDKSVSPDGKFIIYDESVKIKPNLGSDLHTDAPKTTAYIFDELDYRHWDTWNDGSFNHVFYRENREGSTGVDIMKNEPYNSPQKPFGGSEDYTWSPDGKYIVYVSKKLFGTSFVNSTNTDLYRYEIATGKTENLTAENKGYDTEPQFSSQGNLAWMQMKRDGFEADKNDIIVLMGDVKMNLTQNWDGTVNHFQWSKDGKKIYFTAPVDGTIQLFEVDFPGRSKKLPVVTQLTNGDFDVTSIVGFSGDYIVLGRSDMNTANEIFKYNLKTQKWTALTQVNQSVYAKLNKSKVEKLYFETTDGKKMLTWVIYPPNFDPNKKYPTLLYCQGGPQSALTQFYSFRWNFQLMAAQGYIVIAPNRRGMPGHGVEWNEQISKDWGGQVMRDYLTAADEMAKKPFVDESRMGAVGASFGGYSVFYLAGIHNNRFKTFISHCGVFNTESMYGTTEELFFVNWDLGGPYWDKNEDVQKAYSEFNPKSMVQNWNTPMLIIQGGKDYRVPIGQGQEAYTAAQQLGIKSRFLYFPDENHWVLNPQNGIVWQREFFRWLKETL
jgi:dipeptidyl aminopeptidase/acylaminoacyl peptidase